MNNRNISRISAAVLETLAERTGPCKTAHLLNFSSLKGATQPQVDEALIFLAGLGFVQALGDYSGEQPNSWTITEAGRKALAASEDAEAPEPPQDAPTALCCLDEDELDDWWEDLDVEQKADAFLRFSLKRSTTYIYAGEPERRIPILGTANCTPEFEEKPRDRAGAPDEPTANEVAAAAIRASQFGGPANGKDYTSATAAQPYSSSSGPVCYRCNYCGACSYPLDAFTVGNSTVLACRSFDCQKKAREDFDRGAVRGMPLTQADGEAVQA